MKKYLLLLVILWGLSCCHRDIETADSPLDKPLTTAEQLIADIEEKAPPKWEITLEDGVISIKDPNEKVFLSVNIYIVEYVSPEDYSYNVTTKALLMEELETIQKEIDRREIEIIDTSGPWHVIKRAPKTEDDKKLFEKYDDIKKQFSKYPTPEYWYKDISLDTRLGVTRFGDNDSDNPIYYLLKKILNAYEKPMD